MVPSEAAATSMAVPYGTSSMLPSPLRPIAMLTATAASERPMIMMIGPITTGGMKRCTISAPWRFTTAAKTKYTRLTQASAPIVAGMPHVCTE